MELHFLNDILIIAGLAIAASFVCLRLKLPTIVGFLVAGALAGPHGFGLARVWGTLGFLAVAVSLPFLLDAIHDPTRFPAAASCRGQAAGPSPS